MKEILKKLSHPLLEIRRRALSSLKFKLSNHLLQVGDFASDENFIKILLEWFNSEEERFGDEDDFILQVLHSICLYSSSAKATIVQMGGIKFMQDLREDVNNETINSILDLLISHTKTTETLASDNATLQFTPVSNSVCTGPHSFAVADPRSAFQRNKIVHEIPRLQKSVNLPFEYIHLSHADEKFVSDFLNLILQSRDNSSLYEKYLWGLDVLCADFGPQIFLQKTSLLTCILDDLYYSPSHHYFTVTCVIPKIVCSWSKAFRLSADNFRSLSTSTFVNNTPNASISATNFADILSYPKEDLQISLPFAAHEIFESLFDVEALLQMTHDINPILNSITSILHGISPFIRMYLETISTSVEALDGRFDIESMKNGVLYYCHKIILVSRAYSTDDLNIMESFLSLMTGIMSSVPREMFASEAHFLVRILDELLHNYDFVEICPSIMEALVSDSALVSFCSFLLQSTSPIVRLETIKALFAIYQPSVKKAIPELIVEFSKHPEFIFQVLFAASIESYPEAQVLFLDFIKTLLPRWKVLPSVRSCLPLFQALYSYDEGVTLNAFIKDNVDNLEQADYLGMTLRGLFHRDQRYREHCASILAEILKHSNTECPVSTLRDLFVFVNTDLPHFIEVSAKNISKFESMSIENLLGTIDNLDNDNYLELMEAAYWSVRNDSLRSEFIQRGGLASILNFLDRVQRQITISKPELNSAVIVALRSIKVCVSKQPDLATELAWNAEFLLSIASIMTCFNPMLTYEIAKFLTSILFAESIVRCERGRFPENYQNDEMIMPLDRKENDMLTSFNPIIPIAWTSSFNTVGAIIRFSHISSKLRFTVMTAASLANHLCENLSTRRGIASSEILHELKVAKNHNEFMMNLYKFEFVLCCPLTLMNVDTDDIVASLARFLNVLPACQEDVVLFDRIVQFVTRLMLHKTVTSSSWNIVAQCVENTIIPTVKKSVLVADDSSNLLESAMNSCLVFLQRYMEMAPTEDVCLILKRFNLIDLLRQTCLKCFSSRQAGVSDREKRISCLRSIARITSIPQALPLLNVSQLVDLMAVLSHTIGCLQQSFGSHDNFTYQNRSVYRLGVISIRNISRLLVDLKDRSSNQWLFENTLDWLGILLADDEISLHSVALGIISNMTLLEDAHQLLIAKMPDYLDMAFSYALDFDRNEKLRKEAFMILAQYVVRYSYSSDAHNDSHEDLFLMFDRFLFFDRLPDAIDFRRLIISDPSACSLLIRNLASVESRRFGAKIVELGLINVFLSFFMTKNEIESTIRKEMGNEIQNTFDKFRMLQYWELHGKPIRRAQGDIIITLLILIKDNSDLERIVKDSGFISKVLDIVAETDPILLDSNFAESLTFFFRRFKSILIEKYSDVLCTFKIELLQSTIQFLINGRVSDHSWKIFAEFIGEFLSLLKECGFDVHMNNDFDQHQLDQVVSRLLSKAQDDDGHFYLELIELLHAVYDSAFSESCSIYFDKNFSVSFDKLNNLAAGHKLSSKDVQEYISFVKFGSKFAMGLKAMDNLFEFTVLLLQYLCAPMAFSENIKEILNIVVSLNYVAERCKNDLAGMVKSSKVAKKAEKSNSNSVTSTLIGIIMQIMDNCKRDYNAETGSLFHSCIRLISVAVNNSEEVSSHLIKANLVARIVEIRPSFLKHHHRHFVSPILLFISYSFSNNDILVACSNISALTNDLIHIISVSAGNKKQKDLLNQAVCSIRALVSHKEARVAYLADDKFLSSVETLLDNNCYDDNQLLESVLSMIWVFLHDHQKSKAAIRKTRIPALITQKDKQFQTKTGKRLHYMEQVEILLTG